ncbi:MAG: right-handed parallel beta-helix repeat-containing protein [Pirellulaceae bacterium]|nr:right-handed parallel beta-helix repeat-containing protein [Pirellulaceae bacterium]
MLAIGFGVAQPAAAATRKVPAEHATIQAALDACSAGDVVLVAAGEYRERLRLPAGVSLRSEGDQQRGELGLRRAERTVVRGEGLEGQGPGVRMAAGSTLDGFTVTGFGRYDDALWNKHHATQGNEQPHEHIGQFGAPGVGIDGVDCTVTDNIVHHNGDTGIGIRGGLDKSCSPLVTRNVCYRNMGGGIGSMQGSTALIQHNECFQNFFAGIGHSGASPIVLNNECYENIRAGIGVSEGARPIVRGNRCYRNRRAGIGVRTGAETRPVIEDNDCYENAMAGIGCEEQAEPVIRHNRCYKNALAGIGAQSGARPIIVGNQCYENEAAGIGTQEQAQALIVANECRENREAGIGVRNGAQAVISRNRCVENRLVAIGLPDGSRAIIHDNFLVRTGGTPPLVAVKGGSSAILSGNSLHGGGVAGVLVEGHAWLDGNQFQGAGPGQGSAVWVWPNSELSLTNSRFDGYRSAVQASKSAVSIRGNEVRNFEQAAIVVKQPSSPAQVHGNRALATRGDQRVLDVDQPHGDLADNQLVPAPAADQKASPQP